MAVDVLNFIPSSLVPAVLSGTSTVDLSSNLNNALATVGLISLPHTGQISIGSSLLVPSGGGLIADNFGCTIRALPNFGNNPLVRNSISSPASDANRNRSLVLRGIRLDGNRANNSTATEFSHGIQLQGVNGADLDVWVVDCKGDGVSIQPSATVPNVGSTTISGKIRAERSSRQQVTITCGEQIDLAVYSSGGDLMAVDIEPDVPLNFIRNIFIRLLSIGDGNGTDISGGVCVAGDGAGCIPTNVLVDFEVYNSGGQGAIWRDAKGLILRGTIERPARNGLVGIFGGVGGSRVSFQDVKVFSPGGAGLAAREQPGSFYDGHVTVVDAGSIGVQIEDAAGGTLGVSINRSGQQGLYLDRVRDMTFPSPIIENSGSHNIWLRGASVGNRFHFLKSTGSRFGFGFLEDSACNNNRAFLSRVTANAAGNVSTSGAQSLVQLEP